MSLESAADVGKQAGQPTVDLRAIGPPKDGVFCNLNAKPEIIRISDTNDGSPPPVRLPLACLCFIFKSYYEVSRTMPPSYTEAMSAEDTYHEAIIGK